MVPASPVEIVRLVRAQRWGAIATLNDGAPLASMVAYAPERDLEGILFFLSRLSLHTRNLLAAPVASLAVGEPDSGRGDPQTLARVSLQGMVSVVARDSGSFSDAWATYTARFPDAAPRLELGDFELFRLVVDEARYVGGFARAMRLPGDDLRAAARGSEA